MTYNKMYQHEWYLQNREKRLVQAKNYYQNNREKNRQKRLICSKAWKQRNREKYLAYSKVWRHEKNEERFGVFYPTWWLCDICSIPISGSKINLDHDWKTGRFRGWLCVKCNVGLGQYERGFGLYQKYLEGQRI